MNEASKMIIKALQENKDKGLPLLIKAFDIINEWYSELSLGSPKSNTHLNYLKQNALSYRVIGSGSGNYALSIWHESPPSNQPYTFHKVIL